MDVSMESKPLGPVVHRAGCVTTMRSIVGLRPQELESALGYGDYRLEGGFFVYALDEAVGPGEFQWLGTTHFSAGWYYDESIDEFIQIADQFRWTLYKQSGFHGEKSDRQFDASMEQERARLNVRSGPDRIVKVIPVFSGDKYPDSRHKNIPQWRLLKPKRFTLLAKVAEGRRFLPR
jgi:hypothetical protein